MNTQSQRPLSRDVAVMLTNLRAFSNHTFKTIEFEVLLYETATRDVVIEGVRSFYKKAESGDIHISIIVDMVHRSARRKSFITWSLIERLTITAKLNSFAVNYKMSCLHPICNTSKRRKASC